VDHTSGGYRIQISGAFGTAPSSISQIPGGAVGVATRTEARAVLGSPVAGSFTYKVTNTATSEVVVDLTVAVDLGTLTATARYAA
jgi:hypothetical protein